MLLDASKPESQPVQLADIKAGLDDHNCFIGTDGNFHAVESLASTWTQKELQLHVYSPVTGQRLSSQGTNFQFKWPGNLVDSAHTTANRLVCMIDRHTFAPVHSASSEEIARCVPCSGTFPG